MKLGFVTREKLFAMTSRQTEEILYGMLLTSSGMFYFLDAYDENALSSRQKLTVASLIREGVRRMHETRYFRARIPSDQHIPQVEPGRAPPEADPLGLFGVIDGADWLPRLGASWAAASSRCYEVFFSHSIRTRRHEAAAAVPASHRRDLQPSHRTAPT